MIARIWCFIRGHDWLKIRHDNGRSKITYYQCARCSKELTIQFDYNY